MYYRYKPQKNRIKARISEQYRNKTTSNYSMVKSEYEFLSNLTQLFVSIAQHLADQTH